MSTLAPPPILPKTFEAGTKQSSKTSYVKVRVSHRFTKVEVRTVKVFLAYLSSMRTSHAQFIKLLSDTESLETFLDDESRDSLRSSFRIGFGVNDQDVCVRSILRDPDSSSVQLNGGGDVENEGNPR